jgi:fimbrial chaperone protein
MAILNQVLTSSVTSLLSRFLLVLLFFLSSANPSLAAPFFIFSPSSIKLNYSGAGATGTFELKNSGQETIAVQIRIIKRQPSEDGSELYPEEDLEAEEDFIFYPPQVILKPGQIQSIRVTWVGDDSENKELAYRVLAEQVPIILETQNGNTQGRTASINVLVRYANSLYVTSNSFSSKIVLSDAVYQRGEEGEDQLLLTLKNEGSAHKILGDFSLQLKSSQDGSTVTLGKDDIGGVAGENILAGNKRRFVLPWPKELPVGPVTATFTTN